MNWMVPTYKLDTEQKHFIHRFLRDARGNVWLQGHAGSGKSIMLIHGLFDLLNDNPGLRACIVVFTHSLINLIKSGMKELGMVNGKGETVVPVKTYIQFERENPYPFKKYDIIMCDEVQDLAVSTLEKLEKCAGRIIVAGDVNQSIYECHPRTRERVARPEEISGCLDAEPYELTTIYRLTRSMIKIVGKFNRDILEGKTDATKQDVKVRIGYSNDIDEETHWCFSHALKGANVLEPTAIFLPTHKAIVAFCNELLRQNGKPAWEGKNNQYNKPDFSSLNKHLEGNGIQMVYAANGYGLLDEEVARGKVIIMTYYSAKGLDFKNVYLPYLSKQLFIPGDDPETLFLVALTRSRKNLIITHTGLKHRFLERISNECTHFDIQEEIEKDSREGTEDNGKIFF